MEKIRISLAVFLFLILAFFGFMSGLLWSKSVKADDTEKKVRVIYPKESKLDFEGTDIEGQLKNPAEFYFEHRPEEKFDSLVKRRKNFHKELLRDVVLSR